MASKVKMATMKPMKPRAEKDADTAPVKEHAAETSTAVAVSGGMNEPGDALMRAKITLPTYESVTEQRVAQELSSIFKGFVYDPDAAFEKQFKTVDAIADYATACNAELKQIESTSKSQAIRYAGALMARRWYLGHVIHKTLDSASYGTDTAGNLANKMDISKSYLHQMKDVGRRLTVKDTYVLGMYDAGWSHIRSLATIQDDDTRKRIIEMYCASIPDWNDDVCKQKAKACLAAAILAAKKGDMILDSTAPDSEEPAEDLAIKAPEYDAANKFLAKISKQLIFWTSDKVHDEAEKVFNECFIADDIPGAEEELGRFCTRATEALDALNKLTDMLPDLKVHLESLTSMSLTEVE